MVLLTSVAGIPVPAARYTSYEMAVADDGHTSVAVFCVASVAPAAGDVLVTHAGTVGVPIGFTITVTLE